MEYIGRQIEEKAPPLQKDEPTPAWLTGEDIRTRMRRNLLTDRLAFEFDMAIKYGDIALRSKPYAKKKAQR